MRALRRGGALEALRRLPCSPVLLLTLPGRPLAAPPGALPPPDTPPGDGNARPVTQLFIRRRTRHALLLIYSRHLPMALLRRIADLVYCHVRREVT